MNSQISVVIPVYDNAPTLEELHRRLCAALESLSLSFELVFVNDACPRGSGPVLDRLAQTDPRVRVVSMERNGGQHRAVLAGLRAARGSCAVIMDADLQDPPEVLPELVERLSRGYAVVFAGRHGAYESLWRLLTSRVYKYLLHRLCRVPPDAGLFLVMDRRAVEAVLSQPSRSPSVVAMIGCARLPSMSFPIRRPRRTRGTSAYSFWKRLRSAMTALGYAFRWRNRPWPMRKEASR